MVNLNSRTRNALNHIHFLSETIGGRGSCTPQEHQAAEYAASQMKRLGVENIRIETFLGSPSTYRPYALAFSIGLLSTLLVWVFQSRWTLAIASIFNVLGAWGMLAETDFAANWIRWLLPKGQSHNAVGTIPPLNPVKHCAVICAHLDTHRTPIFYSSKTWQALFSGLVGGALLSLVVSTVVYGLGAVFAWTWVRWIGLAAALMEIFALAMSLHADFTPFSPGANDNASGVGVVLELGAQLIDQPLNNTQVWLAFTGCEETADYGIAAFIDTHAAELGPDVVYVIIDQVGKGRLEYLTADGLVIKRPTHPQALAIARQAAQALPSIETAEQVGIAYTDAAVVTKRGLIALTLVAVPPPGSHDSIHWHQMSDTPDKIDPATLSEAFQFTWQVLKILDKR